MFTNLFSGRIDWKEGLFRSWVAISIIFFMISVVSRANEFAIMGSLFFRNEAAIRNEIKYRGYVDYDMIAKDPEGYSNQNFSPEEVSKMRTYLHSEGVFNWGITSQRVPITFSKKILEEIFFRE